MFRAYILRTALPLAAVLVLGACASSSLKDAQQTAPQGPEFTQALYREYLDLSEHDYYSGEGYASYTFAGKARDAAAGMDVAPAAPGGVMGMMTSQAQRQDFTDALARLENVFDRGAKTSAPRHAARAQAAYDCWVFETRGGDEPKRADMCRQRFEATMADIEKSLGAPTSPPVSSRTPSLVIETGR